MLDAKMHNLIQSVYLICTRVVGSAFSFPASADSE